MKVSAIKKKNVIIIKDDINIAPLYALISYNNDQT